jgi:hypothetical protein
MKRFLALVAVAEGATGVALIIDPSLVVRLLFGADIAGAGIVMSRIAGIALIALGVGCWSGSTALCGMLTYSALATLYLAYLGVTGEWLGLLLWPAVVLHLILTAVLASAWFQSRTPD